MSRLDHTGQQYGSCLVLRAANEERTAWVCRCMRCGAERTKPASTVRAAKCQSPPYCRACAPVASTKGLVLRNDEPLPVEAGGLQWTGKHWASSETGLMQQRFYLGMMR